MDHYREEMLAVAVEAASPAGLTLLLYDGAIRFANEALTALEAGDTESAGEYIVRVGSIVLELQATLNHRYALAEPLYDLYQYMYRRLCVATVDESAGRLILTEVRDMLREFRDTWQEAMRLAVA